MQQAEVEAGTAWWVPRAELNRDAHEAGVRSLAVQLAANAERIPEHEGRLRALLAKLAP